MDYGEAIKIFTYAFIVAPISYALFCQQNEESFFTGGDCSSYILNMGLDNTSRPFAADHWVLLNEGSGVNKPEMLLFYRHSNGPNVFYGGLIKS